MPLSQPTTHPPPTPPPPPPPPPRKAPPPGPPWPMVKGHVLSKSAGLHGVCYYPGFRTFYPRVRQIELLSDYCPRWWKRVHLTTAWRIDAYSACAYLQRRWRRSDWDFPVAATRRPPPFRPLMSSWRAPASDVVSFIPTTCAPFMLVVTVPSVERLRFPFHAPTSSQT